jgi:hypothetical protein
VLFLKHYTLKRGPPKPAAKDVENMAADRALPKPNENEDVTSPPLSTHETLQEGGETETSAKNDVSFA